VVGEGVLAAPHRRLTRMPLCGSLGRPSSNREREIGICGKWDVLYLY
jgi:hypothetical protein